MNFFDIIAPIYERLAGQANKTILLLDQFAYFKKTDKILDLGGGTGRISKFFIDKVQEIIVADSSAMMIRECQKKKGLICKLAKAENLSFLSNYFDKIIIINSFHHFQNQKAVGQEIKRVLQSGGILFIEELNPRRFLGKLVNYIENLLGMKSNFYYPEALSLFFSQEGFKTRLINENKSFYYLIVEKI